MRAGDAFFDTGVLVHLADAETAKSGRTEDLLAEGGVVSVQVLDEFAATALRTIGLSWAETHDFLRTFRATLEVVPLTLQTHDRGLEIAERHRLSVGHGMIVAAAQLAGCKVLYSDNMRDGLVIDGLSIRDPYARI